VSFLARPAWLAGNALLLAAAVHPALRLERWPEARAAVPALALLLVLSLLARALAGRLADRVLALGALIALVAAGYDGLRGHTGTLTLETGQGSRSFEEEGPGGRRLGLRPLGFAVRLERVGALGEVVVSVGQGDGLPGALTIGPGRAMSFAGVRLGDPQVAATGEATSLRIAVSGATGTQELDLAPGQAASAGETRIALERYFADFALDEAQKPFSRSTEPRNPAALLDVTRAGRRFRVFVIQALPGIHRQEGLDLSFALVGVEPERAARLRVTESGSAPFLAAGMLLVALGLALALREAG
jgi:hypothetical protein